VSIRPQIDRHRALVVASRLALLGGVLAAWQFLPGSIISESSLSRPSHVFGAVRDLVQSGTVFRPLWLTTYEVAVGVAIGAIAGVTVAVILHTVRPVEWVLEPILAVLYAIPKIVLISLFILWFGIQHKAVIALVVSFAFFIVFYSARGGLESVDPRQREALQLLGAGRLRLARLLLLPTIVPSIYVGLRIAIK
jgi:NitT/TauT family transport system permease protein